MRIKLLLIGKTDDKNLRELISKYQNRLQHYVKFELEVIPELKNIKNFTRFQQKEKEGAFILNKLRATDHLVLFDEKGKAFRSLEFANWLQKKMNSGVKQLVFAIGGPYGFSESVYKKTMEKIALSKMTFSHQMIRLFAIEQFYRGFTILNKEPYHHE
ncbi:MAG: 23S rRNA (pseudouridine(1915)-N(3))-methyltransferase RlmH [Flavobacteriaceae bacterium]|nr:MAG: 23S rRNA (pseudouridine(1915)-N(3))-methyltransferase RlmH [Flavobacteriaceae bacterium]